MKKFEFDMFILMLLGFLIMALSLVGMTSCSSSEEELWRKKLKDEKLETIVTKSLEDERFSYQRTYQSDGVNLILIKDKNTQHEYLCVKVTYGCAIVQLEK